jgi:hypothetical protein
LVAKPCQPTVGNPSQQEASEHSLAWLVSDFLGSRSLIMPSHVGMPMLRGWPLYGCQAKPCQPTVGDPSQQEASEHILAWSVSDFLGSRSLIMPSHVGMPMLRGWPLFGCQAKPCQPTVGDPSQQEASEHILAWSVSDFLGSRSLIMPSHVGMPMLRGWPLLGCQAMPTDCWRPLSARGIRT